MADIGLPGALMWLNDRIGSSAAIHVMLDLGPHTVGVVGHERGELQHWRRGDEAQFWAGHPREDIAGLYSIGDAELDLTELANCPMEIRDATPAQELAVTLDEHVYLRILTWPDGLADA